MIPSRYSEIVDELLRMDFRGKIAIDATLGWGNDFLKLLNAVKEDGFVHGFDIQEKAIEHAYKIFKDYKNFKLHHMSNEFIDIVGKCDLIIYNLGYLPRGDKSIITDENSTRKSIAKALNILNKDGIIIVVQYNSHKGAHEEKIALEEVLKNADQKKFTVIKRDFFNQINEPPTVYLIERIK